MPDGTHAPANPLRTAHAPDAALRVAPAALDWDAAPLPADAGALAQAVAALGRRYFGAMDAGEIETMLACLDPEGFDIHVLAPDAHLTDTAAYRAWHDRITGAFARLRHTIVALAPRMTGPDTATVALSVHSEVDRRDPGAGEPPRANVTLDILWDLARRDGGWRIARQSQNPQPSPAFGTTRTREFAVSYLHALDRRDLPAMLGMLAPAEVLNIALNQGLIIEDFPAWFAGIDRAFVNSDHRVQGVVARENADGTIDAHLRIHFTADRRSPGPDEAPGVDFSVERIWTIRADGAGAPKLIGQRPFVLFDLATRLEPLDVAGALAAARGAQNEALRDWLRAGGDPDAPGRDGFTAFLAAAASGNAEALRMMLRERVGGRGADAGQSLRDPRRPGQDTGILAPHLAAQKGDLTATRLLLRNAPDQLGARIAVNAHTPLLQAAFYGHVDLARMLVEDLGAILPEGTDIAAERHRLFTQTTLRGINATGFGRQFGNDAMVAALAPHDDATEAELAADTASLLAAIPAGPRHPEAGTPAQKASEAAFAAVSDGLAEVARHVGAEAVAARALAALATATADPAFEPDRRAGPLLQPPLVAAVTGTDAHAGVAAARHAMVAHLLAQGADPCAEEAFPMAVDAVIRAAAFNHFDCLKAFQAALSPDAIRDALNRKSAVNGLTALHDSVLRAATTGAEGYLEQIRWARALGAACDIPEHTGRTQRDFAAAAFATDGQRAHASALWEALAPGGPPPRPYRLFGYENLTFLTIPAQVSDKGAVWRALSTMPDVVVRAIALDGPSTMAAEVVQAQGFGTAIFDRHWPDGRPVAAQEVQAMAAQSRGTPFLPIMRFPEPGDPYVKQLLGAGLFGALLIDPESPEAVRAMMRDVYFPQRPDAAARPRVATPEHPLGKRAVGADTIAQRTFAELPKMMDLLNTLFLGGVTFRAPAAPGVLAALPGLKAAGIRLVEVDRDAILARGTASDVTAIEKAAREAGLVLTGHFPTEAGIAEAVARGYRHVVVVTQSEAFETAWRKWVPGGKLQSERALLPREMAIRPPQDGFNDARRALEAGELLVFGAQTTPDPHVAVQLARSGILNGIALEREHSAWTTEETLRHVALLRPLTNVLVRTGSALDPDVGAFVAAGVAVLIATAVQGAGEARVFLDAVRAANLATYGADAARWCVPAVMMETEAAAADAEEIIALLRAHWGVCHPGPLDLSASLGAAWGTPRYEETLARIESAAKAAGVPLAGVLNTLQAALDHGFGMVLAPMGMDAGGLNAGLAGANPLESPQGDNSA
jgi:ankyrin repeat protein